MKESFYYSNMCPQTPKLNRGIWKKLENYTRGLVGEDDSVLVWCGSVAKSGRTIGPDDVVVPDYCWKILFNEPPRRKQRGIVCRNELHIAASGGEFNPADN